MNAGRLWIVCFWSALVLWLVHPLQTYSQGTPPTDQPLNEALATTVTVRVVGHGSLVLGREVGGARVTITDLATGQILASGLQQGEAGDQNQIMHTPHFMREPLYSAAPSASFSTTLYLTHPIQVEIAAQGPLSYPAAAQRASKTVWLIPGQHMTGDGIVLQLYGYIVQIVEPKAETSLIAKEDQPLRVSVRTLAGTPVRPHGDWDSRQVHIYGEVVVGGRTRVKVVKNKVAPPFREAEFDVMYGERISKSGDLLDLAVEKRIVEKSGAWFAYSGERLGQGRENAKQFLKENPEVFKAIEDRVRRELGLLREADVIAV